MKGFTRLLMLVGLCALLTQLAFSGGPFTVTLQVQSSSASDSIKTLVLGLDPAVMYGIDSLHGVLEQPPIPPTGVLDARFVDIPGRAPAMGVGIIRDLRHFIRDTQSDTFKITFQKSTEGDSLWIKWPGNLASVGGGGWRMTDLLGGVVLDVDMAAGDSAVLIGHASPVAGVYIYHYDNYKAYTTPYDSLALTKDLKGKIGKFISAKPTWDEFCLTVTDTVVSVPVDGLHMEFSTTLDPTSVSISLFPPGTTINNKKWDWKSPVDLTPGTVIQICAEGIKGKLQKISKWYWTKGGLQIIIAKKKIKYGDINVTYLYNRVRQPFPNLLNAIRDIYPPSGLQMGDPALVNNVLMPKIGDLLKSLQSKSGLYLHTGVPHYFDLLAGKIWKKQQKAYTPDKNSNNLFGEALTLKLNVMLSQSGETPTGLDLVQIDLPGSPYNGLTIGQVVAYCDYFLTHDTVLTNPLVNAGNLDTICHDLNWAFQGPLDTVGMSWDGTIHFKGAKSIKDIPWLVRPTASVAPVTVPVHQSTLAEIPERFELRQNYPNPFNPTTTIEFNLPEEALVTVKVYNLLGQEVMTLADHQQFSDGTNEVEFNAANYASGVYFYRVIVNDITNGAVKFQEVKKMMLLK